MKKQHLFTLDIELIKELHRRVGRGFRSQFVNEAISNRLKNEEEYSSKDVPTYTLAAQLMARLQEQNNWVHTPLTLLLKELIE